MWKNTVIRKIVVMSYVPMRPREEEAEALEMVVEGMMGCKNDQHYGESEYTQEN